MLRPVAGNCWFGPCPTAFAITGRRWPAAPPGRWPLPNRSLHGRGAAVATLVPRGCGPRSATSPRALLLEVPVLTRAARPEGLAALSRRRGRPLPRGTPGGFAAPWPEPPRLYRPEGSGRQPCGQHHLLIPSGAVVPRPRSALRRTGTGRRSGSPEEGRPAMAVRLGRRRAGAAPQYQGQGRATPTTKRGYRGWRGR